jgi:hypothetical protein
MEVEAASAGKLVDSVLRDIPNFHAGIPHIDVKILTYVSLVNRSTLIGPFF